MLKIFENLQLEVKIIYVLNHNIAQSLKKLILTIFIIHAQRAFFSRANLYLFNSLCIVVMQLFFASIKDSIWTI